MAIKKIAHIDGQPPQIIPMERIINNGGVTTRFKKIAEQLRAIQSQGKQLSPKIDDFLYAHCIMMHAAEASLLDDKGQIKKNAEGKDVQGGFQPFVDHKGNESLRWSSPDNIQPYKNGNGDIFPEAELIKAHKDWIGKPLCRDHVSNSIDGVRGVIIDTYYDTKCKRVHALFALDRKNYADLARKIEAGYATNVSMGTAVGRSICTTCGNVATIEAEYCSHVRGRNCFGEINIDLSPIELSIVVTGADPGAKIKTVLAHLIDYENQIEKLKTANHINIDTINAVKYGISGLEQEIAKNASQVKPPELNLIRRILGSNDGDSAAYAKAKQKLVTLLEQDLSLVSASELVDLAEVLNNKKDTDLATRVSMMVLDRKDADPGQASVLDASVQPESKDNTLGLTDSDGNGLSSDVDLLDQSQFKGKPGDPMMFSGPSTDTVYNFSHLYVANEKTGTDTKASMDIQNKIASLKKQLKNLENMVVSHKENVMSFADFRNRGNRRLAYLQGTEDPKDYPPMGDADKIRDGEDKQMVGDELDTGAENPDMKSRELLQRAEQEERMAKRAKILEKIKVGTAKVLVDPQTGKASAVEEDGKVKEVEQKAEDEKAKEKLAYFQGTEDPKPGAKQYPPMGDSDKIRDGLDKQMVGDELNLGADNPDEAVKKSLQRIAGKQLKAKFIKADRAENSTWIVLADADKVFNVTAKAAYGDSLNRKASGDHTFADFFASKEYGKRLMKLVRAAGPEGAAAEMGLPAMPEAAPAAPAAPGADAAPALPDVAPSADEPAKPDDVEKLKTDIQKGIDALDEGVEQLRAAVSTDEGLKEPSVDMPEAPSAEGDIGGAPALPGPTAAISDRDMLEAYAFLNDSLNELSFIKSRLVKGASKELVLVGRQALRDAKLMTHEASLLRQAFVTKVAEEQACGDDMGMMVLDREELGQVEHEVNEGVEDHEDGMHHGTSNQNAQMVMPFDAKDKMSDKDKEKAEKIEEDIKKLQDELDDLKNNDEGEAAPEEADAMDKQARKEWRRNIVANAGALDPLFESTRKGGGYTLEGLDTKVSDDGAKVETLDEVADAILDVATKDPNGPKVRQAAKNLDQAIKSGLIQVANLEKLVAMGAVDSEAAAYWKNFYGQADGGKEFAQGLVQDFHKQASEDVSEQKIVRYKRAFSLGLEAQTKGLVARSKVELDKYVDSLVNLPDHVFTSMKNIVEQHRPIKTASFVPHVGLHDDQDLRVDSSNSAPKAEDLARLFLKK